MLTAIPELPANIPYDEVVEVCGVKPEPYWAYLVKEGAGKLIQQRRHVVTDELRQVDPGVYQRIFERRLGPRVF